MHYLSNPIDPKNRYLQYFRKRKKSTVQVADQVFRQDVGCTSNNQLFLSFLERSSQTSSRSCDHLSGDSSSTSEWRVVSIANAGGAKLLRKCQKKDGSSIVIVVRCQNCRVDYLKGRRPILQPALASPHSHQPFQNEGSWPWIPKLGSHLPWTIVAGYVLLERGLNTQVFPISMWFIAIKTVCIPRLLPGPQFSVCPVNQVCEHCWGGALLFSCSAGTCSCTGSSEVQTFWPGGREEGNQTPWRLSSSPRTTWNPCSTCWMPLLQSHTLPEKSQNLHQC